MVSVRQFRQNFSKYLHEAEKKQVHFVVMRHADPVVHIQPVRRRKKTKKELEVEKFWAEVEETKKEFDEGRYYTQEEIGELLRIRSGLPLAKGQKKISIVFPKPRPTGFTRK